ncbi:MAG: hypothetical protein CMG07_02145 [Candidatus Marinimicrobia bacterium]|nr:hypothetical protein [Candidatus Neomarinimicrobiota bacterium]
MPQEFTEDDCPECPPEGLPIWMGTFADMMTLLFAFFVLLFSLSRMDPVKMADMAEAMTEHTTGAREPGDPEATMPPRKSSGQIKEELKEIKGELPESISDKVSVSSDALGVALEMQGDICFRGGSVDMNQAMMDILDVASEALMTHPKDLRRIYVQGHSDNMPVSGKLKEKYPTNWELSAARAAVVVNYLISAKGINPTRLQASGFADRWPSGIDFMQMRATVKDTVNNTYSAYVDDNLIREYNNTSEKQARNRRIKIIFSPS